MVQLLKIVVFTTFFLLFWNESFAIDCSKTKPFVPIGSQEVEVSAARFYWEKGKQRDEDICTKSVFVAVYNVQGREDEAYSCLKPVPNQVITCSTKYLGNKAIVTIVPGVWVRKWKSGEILRASRFHSYIQSASNPKKYLDVYARNLSKDLAGKYSILEGAKKSGEDSSENESFWFRLIFKNETKKSL